MEGESKNKNGLVWVLVVIIILLIGVVAYFGYLVYQQKNNNSADNISTTTTTTPTTIKSQSLNINVKELFASSMDSSVKKITPNVTDEEKKSDFKNLDKSNDDYKIIVNCTEYDEGECIGYSVKVNSTIEYNNNWRGCSTNGELYTINDYLILVDEYDGCVSALKIHIYDKNNQEIYTSNSGYSSILVTDGEIKTSPIIMDSILYFVEKLEQNNKAVLKFIDLSSSILDAKTLKIIDVKYDLEPKS